jgi:hypothetical protein
MAVRRAVIIGTANARAKIIGQVWQRFSSLHIRKPGRLTLTDAIFPGREHVEAQLHEAITMINTAVQLCFDTGNPAYARDPKVVAIADHLLAVAPREPAVRDEISRLSAWATRSTPLPSWSELESRFLQENPRSTLLGFPQQLSLSLTNTILSTPPGRALIPGPALSAAVAALDLAISNGAVAEYRSAYNTFRYTLDTIACFHPLRVTLFRVVADVLVDRVETTGDPADLNLAIQAHQFAVDIAMDVEPGDDRNGDPVQADRLETRPGPRDRQRPTRGAGRNTRQPSPRHHPEPTR